MENNLSKNDMNMKNRLGMKEILFYFAILTFCYFSFQHGDILHTGGSSITYLNGHFLDFYEVNLKALGGNNYLPSTYIIFAIWNIPIRLLGLVKEPTIDVGYVVFWYKLLPSLFYGASAYIIYKIGIVLGLSKGNSKLMTAFWVSTPIAFFSQFIFGQYDILTTFFVLLGFLFYLKKNIKLFILFFAIAMTFKYFPLFIFIPLLLMIEKRPVKLIAYITAFILPTALEILPYYHSTAFKDGVFGFSANQRLFSAGFQIEYNLTLSIFLVLWFIICGFAFWKNFKDDRDFINWALYCPMLVTSLLFSLMLWHPQWLLLATPFLAITTFLHKRANFFVLIDLVMMYFFIGFTVNFWKGNVDQNLWDLGIFGKHIDALLYDPYSVTFMKTFFIPNDISIYFSFISACFFINMIFKAPVWESSFSKSDKYNDLPIKKHWNLVRNRFIIGIILFIIPAIITILLPIHGKPIYNQIPGKLSKPPIPIGEMTQGLVVGQVFKAKCSKIETINIQLATYARVNSSHLIFNLREYSSSGNGKIIFTKEINANELKDNEYYRVNLNGLPVSYEKLYSFEIHSNDSSQGNAVTIYHTSETQNLENMFAILNEVKQDYNLNFTLYGKR